MPNFKAMRVGNFLKDDFDVLQYRRFTHPICAFCKIKPVSTSSPTYKESLARGFLKSIDGQLGIIGKISKEQGLANKLEGRETYFWGYGESFNRYREVFSKCHPRAILSDKEEHPESIMGIKVLNPYEVLGKSDILPIIIFGWPKMLRETEKKIRENWPEYTEIYMI